MRARSAKIQIFDRSAVSCPVEHRTHGEYLIQREFAMKYLTARQAVGLFEIQRGDDLTMKNLSREIRRALRDSFDHGVTQRRPLLLPVSILQCVRRVLHINRHDVLACWRK